MSYSYRYVSAWWVNGSQAMTQWLTRIWQLVWPMIRNPLSALYVRHIRHIIGHFGDKTFQAIDCTSWYWQPKTRKQNTTYTLNTKQKQKKNCRKRSGSYFSRNKFIWLVKLYCPKFIKTQPKTYPVLFLQLGPHMGHQSLEAVIVVAPPLTSMSIQVGADACIPSPLPLSGWWQYV